MKDETECRHSEYDVIERENSTKTIGKCRRCNFETEVTYLYPKHVYTPVDNSNTKDETKL